METNCRHKKNRPNLFIMLLSLVIICSITNVASAEPRILSVSPIQLSQQNQVSQVAATVYDVTGSFQLTIDGTVVDAIRSGDTVTYDKSFAPGLHKAYLSATDDSGVVAERFWTFYVNDQAKGYLLPDKNTCETCHPNTFYTFPGHLEDLSITGGHPYNCGACHYYGSRAPASQLLLRADGTAQNISCSACHVPHNAGPANVSLLVPPQHDNTNWIGNWSSEGNTIKAPRVDMDCQYCHQPGTRVRLGHDLVADHEVEDAECTSCHSKILTVVHNKVDLSCDTCHNSSDPAVQNIVKTPMVAKAGNHTSQTGIPKTISTEYFDDLNLTTVSLTVYGPDAEAVSPAWSPGGNLQIKRVTVDGWSLNDKPYVLAFVAKENKWYTLSVIDEGKVLYGRYPSNFMARELFLPTGTTKIKTKLISGPGDSSYIGNFEVKEAYYNQPAKCTDCHSNTDHESFHTETGLTANCATCHQDSLTQEHDRVTKAGTQLDCATCHNSSNTTVQDAVYGGNKGCAACHPNAGDHESSHVSVIDGGVVRATEMTNNLSNPGCISCHANYPTQHSFAKCSPCHGGYLPGTVAQPNITAMWNCRYCHLTKVYDTYIGGNGVPDYTGYMSGFRSYLDPLHNGTLGTKNWWQAGHYGNGGIQYAPPNEPRVDSDFNYHNNSPGFKHTSNSITADCVLCHKKTLTAEHTGKTRVTNNPTEDFEDGIYTFNFTGYWGGEFVRSNETAFSGSYSFKSMTVGGSTRYAPTPSSTTETTVNVGDNGNISFVYKVVSSGKLSFYIDGVEMLTDGAATAWTPLSYQLPAGTHTLKWKSTWSSVYLDDLAVTGATTTYSLDCNSCHLSSDPTVKLAIANHNSSCTACHTQQTSHIEAGKTVLDNKCTTCHQSSITKEHDRVNQAGQQLDCATCHSSADPAIKQAITDGNANCANCHPQAGHVDTHTSSILDSKCQTCHSGSLVDEHMNNSVTTGSNNYNCHTCHATTGKAVKRTIANNNRDCTGCHTEGHKMIFTAQVPTDIPLYAGFQWTTPIEVSLFNGEATTPAGYENGQVIISKRRLDVTATQLWNYYKLELVNQGWTVKSGTPAPGTTKFTVEVEKAGRLATIKCYNTTTSNGAVVSTAGNRMEIWYK